MNPDTTAALPDTLPFLVTAVLYGPHKTVTGRLDVGVNLQIDANAYRQSAGENEAAYGLKLLESFTEEYLETTGFVDADTAHAYLEGLRSNLDGSTEIPQKVLDRHGLTPDTVGNQLLVWSAPGYPDYPDAHRTIAVENHRTRFEPSGDDDQDEPTVQHYTWDVMVPDNAATRGLCERLGELVGISDDPDERDDTLRIQEVVKLLEALDLFAD